MSIGSSDEVTCTEVGGSASHTIESSAGTSPYSTGGGGFTFERKVAAKYLAHLLVGDNAVEFGEGRRAVSVAFQQAPENPADDLVIRTARPDEPEPSFELEVEVRRSPNLVASDADARKLVRRFVRAVLDTPNDAMEHAIGLVVAGSQPHAEQLAILADHAAVQMDAPGFFRLIRTPERFDSGVRRRLDHLEKLVERALNDFGVLQPDTTLVQQRTWELLSRLIVLMPRLETPDEADWANVTNRLINVARGSNLAGATELRNKLVALAAEYSPKAARIDLALLRRDAHGELDSSVRRYQEGWHILDSLQRSALQMATDEIVSGDGTRRLRLDRSDQANELIRIVEENSALIVSGDSGVGKSALTIMSFDSFCSEQPQIAQALCLNLRNVPKLTIDFEDILGCPLSTLLSELSAPQRLLIVDGADAVAEGMEDVFRYLVDAAMASEVKIVAVAAKDSKQVVRDALTDTLGDDVAEYGVKPLTDGELDEVVETFSELGRLHADPRSREVLRRLVVVDLLIRGNLPGIPLNDAGAMRDVWSGLVRQNEPLDRGHPDARELALLRLAELTLRGGDRLDVVNSLDAAAISGLRQDGLLRTSPDNPFMAGPDFAHDEVRRYAVARLLLSDNDSTSRILDSGAPRWALGASRLACEALLGLPDVAATPIQGRFGALQGSFDALDAAGHGARWADVPSEALLTLADSSEVFRDAWSFLRADDSAGLRRIARLVNQRLRDPNGFVRIDAIEPIIALLLEDERPWDSGQYVSDLLREWLQALSIANAPVGHPLRIQLRRLLVEEGAAADRRFADRREAEAAARASRTPEAIERERQFFQDHSHLLGEIGYGGRTRRQSPEVPREIRDEVFLELLALLGPDLDSEGETILRRVSEGAPSCLVPAIEGTLTALSLASYRVDLLIQLTEAYYLDDEADAHSTFDDGIRDHRIRLSGLYSPLYGPFMTLFGTEFRGGVAVLNRLLNHAAHIRVSKLKRLSRDSQIFRLMDSGPHQVELRISGTPRMYVGDEQVWRWYRCTGVGPYPCMSALLALERACDQLIKNGVSIGTLVSILLDGCENLAMVGLIVGILIRHIGVTGNLLDRYLVEPFIWRYEFKRAIHEHDLIAASSEGIEASERREWTLRHASSLMVLQADDERVEDLRDLGQALIERARILIDQQGETEAVEDEISSGETIGLKLSAVRLWASSLDYDNYQVVEAPDAQYLQVVPPEEVVQELQDGSEELGLVAEELRLISRYFVKPSKEYSEASDTDELVADIASAGNLLEEPPSLGANHPWDVPTLVAATALEAHLLRAVDLPEDALGFALETVLRVAEGEGSPRLYEYEDTNFEQGADRSAARVIPLLLLPSAAHLRAMIEADNGPPALERVANAGFSAAQAVANEARLHLARGLDHLWATPCVYDGSCHHQIGLEIVTEMMRDCALGDWNPNTQMRDVIRLDDPPSRSIAHIRDESILASRLDASIRALAPATMSDTCISTAAGDMLTTVFSTQSRSLLWREEHKIDYRGNHFLVRARALLTLAQDGNDTVIYESVSAYASNAALLHGILSALSAAAEETAERAAVARRVWPSLIRHVLDFYHAVDPAIGSTIYKDFALASLIPNSEPESGFLYRELKGEPIIWWEPFELRSEIELWVQAAAGNAVCVDQLISFLGVLTTEDQTRIGLPWLAKLVLCSPGEIAKASIMVVTWLIETRLAAISTGLGDLWQQVVDVLVVEGVRRLASYSV